MSSRYDLAALPPLNNPTEGETRIIVEDSSIGQTITVEQARALLAVGPIGATGPRGFAGASGPTGPFGINGATGPYPSFVSVPAQTTSTGIQGQLASTGTDLYVCVSTDYWLKFSGTTF